MGAEESILRSYDVGCPYEQKAWKESTTTVENRPVSSGSSLSCKLDFKVCPAVNKDNRTNISILIFPKKEGLRNCLNYAKVLRAVRHPFILKYIGIFENDASVKLLTEDVLPLIHCIHDLQPCEIVAGMHNLLEALIFMHERGCLAHGNLCLSSVFVSRKDGSWKLGGMEKAERISPAGMINDVSDYINLALTLLDKGNEKSTFEQRLEKLKMDYQNAEMTNLDTHDLKALLHDPIFKNDYLEILKFFDEITMKQEPEKEAFFKSLGENLRKLDHGVVTQKLLKRLFSEITLAEPSAEQFFVPELLSYKEGHMWRSIFSEENFKQYCIPYILKLMFSNEVHVRLLLLNHMPLFINAFDQEIIKNEILPEVLVGVRDENDAIVSATLQGLACLVKILGGDVVIGGERTRLFKDQRPKFSGEVYSACPILCQHHNQSHPFRNLGGAKLESPLRGQDGDRLPCTERKMRKKSESLPTFIRQCANQSTTDEEVHRGNLTVATPKDGIEVEKFNGSDDSCPDWEGFEAFSSGSEQEEDAEGKSIKTSKSVNSLLQISPTSIDTNYKMEPESGTQLLETLHFQCLISRDSRHAEEDSPSCVNNQSSTSVSGQHGLPDNLPNASISSSSFNTCKVQQNINKNLGEEFEFHISANQNVEPDFFADMTPDLSKSKTVLIERSLPTVSSKFEVPRANEEVFPGWEDGGWVDDVL